MALEYRSEGTAVDASQIRDVGSQFNFFEFSPQPSLLLFDSVDVHMPASMVISFMNIYVPGRTHV
jgi:hypothetical protein